MKTNRIFLAAAVVAAALTLSGAARADMVLKNNPELAGLNVITNAMGSSSFFPDACTNFTMEAWIKPTDYQSRTDTYSPIFSVTTSDKSGYSRYIFGLRQRKLSLFQATVTSGDRFPVSSADISLDTWTHVAVAHTATDVKFYINGVLDATATGSFLPPVGEYNNSHLTIGGYHSVVGLNTSSYTTARVFQGSLADVRVWTKARTAEEIAADYQKRLRGDEDNLLLYAPFNDANGSVARDMVSGQRLIAPPTMQFVEEGDLSLSPASAKLIGDGYLASTRTGGNQGASAIVTDVDFANKQDGTGPDFTFETWLRVPQQEANDQWLFSKFAESGDTGWIGLDIRGTTLTPEVVISGQRFTLSDPIEVDRWYHLAATRAGSSYAIYLDGAPAKSGTCRTTGFSANNAAAPVKLLNAGSNKSFGGDVKEMRIWNVARTAEQIAAYYDKAATGREEGLIGCWAMNEGYGTNVYNKATGAAQSIAVGGMGLARGSYLMLTGPKQTIETDVKLTTSDFTLEAWVRDDSPTTRLGGNGRGYILSQYQASTDWVSLCFGGAKSLKPGLRISSTQFFESSTAIEKGKWFHLAGTREGSTVKVYLNGELVNTTTYDGALGVPGTYLTFG
ncbi:MAG: LamG domain-containing protein, partial [Kiritimatiellae bacterium]|nr:LamG domain-containing protein [Kiritimatiellia bacterium]